MRYYDQGCFFRVCYSRSDAEDFRSNWPCSTVRGAGWFEFDARNGDLVDCSDRKDDGADWLAFSQDCQAYGEKKRKEKKPDSP